MEPVGNGHHGLRPCLEAPLLENHRKDDVGLHVRPTAVGEAKHQIALGAPAAMIAFLEVALGLISVAFVGRLGAAKLAGSAMAVSFANIFGFSILEGLSGGLATSGGQAYGAGQHQLLGLLLQRAIFVLLLFCLPISILWIYSPAVLLLWGQDPEIAVLSGQYLLYLLSGLFATASSSRWLNFCNLQWWAYEIIQFMSGWLPHPDITVAAMTISYQTIQIFYVLSLGLSTAAGVRVANELGAQRPERAIFEVCVALVLATGIGGILTVVLLVSPNEWALLSISPSETEVVTLVALLMPTIVLTIVGLTWCATLSALRGSGQQLGGSIINGLTLCGVAIPCAYYFGIRKAMGLQGLWWGLVLGLFLQGVSQTVLVGKTNWTYQATRALAMIEENS